MKCVKYTTQTDIVLTASQVESNCNSISFLNVGSDVVTVDNVRLLPGNSFDINGNFGEVNIKVYTVIFLTTTNPQLAVVRKIYVE